MRKLSINSEKKKKKNSGLLKNFRSWATGFLFFFLGSYDFTLEIIAGIPSYKMGVMKVAAS